MSTALGQPTELDDDHHDPALVDPLDTGSLSPLERGELIARVPRQHPQLEYLVHPERAPNGDG